MKETPSSKDLTEEVTMNSSEISKKTNLLELCSTSIDGSKPCQNPSASSSSLDLKALSLSVSFSGWRCTKTNFKSWAVKMAALHKPIWLQAGIFEAVMASTNTIRKDIDLVLSVAEKWCPETNTFVFPWGEATVTLEDVMLLLGFSVLGSPVYAGLDSEEEKIKAKLEIEWSKIAKDVKGNYLVYQAPWVKRFNGCGDELEHVAFLVTWLSYFVFPSRFKRIYKSIFPIAVHLSRGTRIALAPAVLAHLYAELSILKSHIRAFTVSKDIKSIVLRGLFKLVQVWAWERFKELQPVPNELVKGEPRLALWHNLHHRTSEVRQILDNSRLDSFEWRPYTKAVENWEFPKFYPERAMFVPVDPNLDDEFVFFARCFKVSELVGIDCMEHYFPDRVPSQFGMIQDVPGPVERNKLSHEEAWKSYSKPIDDLTLYIPSRCAVPFDNFKFSDWWRKFSSQENLVVESDETLRQRNITSVVPSSSKISKTSKDGIQNSEGDSFELLVERSRLVVDINDSGPQQYLDLIRADGDETIQTPQEEQRTDETGSKSGKNMVLSPLDENNSSDPPLGETNDIAVSPPTTIQNCEDELDVLGSNAEKMTIIDDGSKEPECLLHGDGAIIAGEKASSGEKEDDTVYDDKVIADGCEEPECLLPEDGGIAGENLIQQRLAIEELASKANNNEPTPHQKLANGDERSMVLSPSDESNIHIALRGETQGQDCLIHDLARTIEESRKINEQLKELEKRNKDVVVENDVANDSYKRSLLKLKDSFDESSHELKKLDSTIDELIVQVERNMAWLAEQRAKR